MNSVKTDKMLISFCIPVYNIGRDLLLQCIDSLIGQGYPDIEIICCDDCSSDESYEVLEELKNTDAYPMTVLRNEKNMGVSYSRNRCMETAKGEYIWFVDPDDLLYPGALNMILKHTADKPDAVIGSYIRVPFEFSSDDFSGMHSAAAAGEGRRVKTVGNEWYPSDPDGRRIYGVWGGIFRRSFLLEHGLHFAEGMAFAEDRMFYYEFSQHDPAVIRIDTPVYFYRQRPESYMHQRLDKRSRTEYESLKMALKIYRSYKGSGKDLKPEVTEDRIHRHKIACVRILCLIPDEAYVRSELSEMIRNGDYPVRTNFSASDIVKDPRKMIDAIICRKIGFDGVRRILRLKKRISF